MNIMQKKMNKFYRLTIMVLTALLPALSGAAQAGAVDYKNQYRGQSYQVQSTMSQGTAVTPAVGFQSTSAYSGQWNQDAQQSMLNEDGSVNADAYGVGRQNAPGVRRSGSGSGYNPGTPDDDEEEEGEQQPIGDGLPVLTLLALAYFIVRVARRGTRALEH